MQDAPNSAWFLLFALHKLGVGKYRNMSFILATMILRNIRRNV